MISIDNISKRYAGHQALDRVSFKIPSQEIFGLLGPNGAGKTSLLRIINQIIQSDEGSVTINGELLEQKHIRKIGYLPEERGLYKKMEVAYQLLYLAQLRGLSLYDAKQNLNKWLDKLQISTIRDKKLESLSKGMQQKVQFIAAVIHEPSLIILDEPFSGFDPVTAELIKENILALNQQGATIIISTHRMESVEELCNSIVLINKSKKVLEGKVSEIREAFKDATYSLVYEGDKEAVSSNRRVSVLSHQTINGHQHSLIVKLGEEGAPRDFINEFLSKKISLVSFNEVVPSMNDIFIKTVNFIN